MGEKRAFKRNRHKPCAGPGRPASMLTRLSYVEPALFRDRVPNDQGIPGSALLIIFRLAELQPNRTTSDAIQCIRSNTAANPGGLKEWFAYFD